VVSCLIGVASTAAGLMPVLDSPCLRAKWQAKRLYTLAARQGLEISVCK
jgi:hypothetical protein